MFLRYPRPVSDRPEDLVRTAAFAMWSTLPAAVAAAGRGDRAFAFARAIQMEYALVCRKRKRQVAV